MNRQRNNHELGAIYSRVAVPVGLVVAIAASQVAQAQQVSAAETDTAVLPVIIKAEASEAGHPTLRVDPRPLIPNAAWLYDVEPHALARVTADVIRRRIDIIRAVGLPVVDTILVDRSRKCPGALRISPPDSLSRGCPEAPFDVLAVGPPRPGSAVLPGDSVYDRNAEAAARGYWAVRIILYGFGHGRSGGYAADYVLAYRNGTWVTVKRVLLIYAD